MTTRSNEPIWAIAIHERWRQCSQCAEDWEEDPERTRARCPACGSMTTLDASSLSGPTGVRAAAAATAARYGSASTHYFSGHGRIGREHWWLGYCFPAVAVSAFARLVVELLQLAGLRSVDVAVSLIGASALISAWLLIVGAVKRWHDHGKSGWWVLIGLVPIAGPLWSCFMWGFKAGTDGPNRFGADPRGPA
jgi:uncharacterized membrane protein YhaH (DUF805 family)